MIYTLKQKFFDVLILFMLVLSTRSILFVMNRNIASISFLFLLIFVIGFLGNKFKKSVVYSSALSVSTIIILGIINYTFAITIQSGDKYLFYLLTLLLSALVLVHFKNNRAEEAFLNSSYVVLKIILAHTLLNFIFFFIVKNNLTPITSTYHEFHTFFNLFFYSEDIIIDVAGIEFCRNQGLFSEPGGLQIFLNMLFFLEAFIKKRSNLLLLVIAFAIVTTYSTAGLILLLLQIVVYFVKEFKHNKALLPAIIALIIPIYFIFSLNIENKIYGERESSFQKRLFDSTQPLFIALEYPLTGIGLDVVQFQRMRQEFHFYSSSFNSLQEQTGIQSKSKGTDKGSSNSIMFLFAGVGFPTAFLLLYMFINQQIITKMRWLWLLIMIVSVMAEPLLLRPFFFLFIISGFNQVFYRISSHKKQIS